MRFVVASGRAASASRTELVLARNPAGKMDGRGSGFGDGYGWGTPQGTFGAGSGEVYGAGAGNGTNERK